ncbi:MAG TPA: GAF domain-containing protein [Candidatus Eisenbacteria bacterium]|nr:GAF domain-containing protein [Candidatus Eisenbacteria bacterium]
MRLAFLDLPDDRVDLISLASRTPSVEIVLVVHSDPEALSLEIAEVLQIPRSAEPLDLLSLKPDQVALPSLEAPGAKALLRSGISERIFTSLDEIHSRLQDPVPPTIQDIPIADGDADGDGVVAPTVQGRTARSSGDPEPLQAWEAMFDEATGGLGKIQDAMDLTDDRSRVLNEILTLAVDQTGAEMGSIMILDEEEGELTIAFANGIPSETVRSTRQKLGEGISGKVAQDRTPLLIHDPSPESRADPRERSRIRAAMCAPIQMGDRVLGVINVSSHQADKRFEDLDLQRLVRIAERIATILDRVVQVQRRDADAAEFRARRGVEMALTREKLDQDERLRLAATRIASALRADAVQIYLAVPGEERFHVVSSGTAAGVQGRMPVGEGLVASVHEDGEPLCLTARRSGSKGVLSRLILAPLQGRDSMGVIAIENRSLKEEETEEETRLVVRLGRLIAQHIELHRGEGAIRQEQLLAKLADIAPRLMVPHDLDSLLLESAAALRAICPSGLVSARLRGEGDEVAIRSSVAGSTADPTALTKLDEELGTLAVRDGKESASPEGSGSNTEVRFACVPVRTADRVIGAVTAVVPRNETASSPLGAPELEAIRKLALYVALAWERTQSTEAPAPSAIADPATGLIAASALEARVLEEVKRAERYHDKFLLTLCAIAGYHDLVERHGAEWTEGLIRDFAKSLSRNVREVDLVARVGDGRFAVLSPETDKDHGAMLKRLDQLLLDAQKTREVPYTEQVQLIGRQYVFPEDVPTGGEMVALLRGSYAVP